MGLRAEIGRGNLWKANQNWMSDSGAGSHSEEWAQQDTALQAQ